MRADARYAVLLVLGLCVIAALAFSFSGPLIYSLEKDVFFSRFHDNTDVLKIQSLNSTTDVLPLMQDLLDFTGPIVINIRIQDIEQARRDLELFAKRHGSFDNLIIRLDMSESEMEEFSKSNALQQQLLMELLNSSVSLDSLKTLEIQYRDTNRPDMLMSIQYQGDAIRKKVRELYVQYQKETEKVVEISTKYGLDVTSEEESLQEFERYIREIDATEKSQAVFDFPIRRSAQLSLLIYPETGRYGDTIRCFGYYFSLYGFRVQGTPGKQITLFLDDGPVGTVMTDNIGSYTINVPIYKVTAGAHTLHAESGITQSDVRILTITPVDSTTTLSVTKANSKGEVTCTGSVIANRPVRSAPVQLVWDQTHVVETTTSANGEFKTTIRLPDGTHTLVARFSAEGYPLTPSESEPHVVDISILRIITPIMPDLHWEVLFLMVAGIFFLFVGGAWYYLRRMPGKKPFGDWISRELGRHEVILPDRGPPDQEIPEQGRPADTPAGETPAPESLIERYTRILQEEGLSAAARSAYQQFAMHIARELQISRYRSLTPREVSRSCTKKPYCGPFSVFVTIYEQVRYGGFRSLKTRAEFETAMHTTRSTLEER